MTRRSTNVIRTLDDKLPLSTKKNMQVTNKGTQATNLTKNHGE